MTDTLTTLDDRLDNLVTLDLGGRGVEHLFTAARARQGTSLVGAAADALAAVPDGATVVITTGSVSRAWISPTVGENDGPAGAAVIARALALAKNVTPVIVAEETLLAGLAAMATSAGLSVLPYEQARIAAGDGSLAAASVMGFPTTDAEADTAAADLLDSLAPALLFSTERVGRAVDGVYYSMRAVDYGMGRARIDRLFDEARRRGFPTVAVGDGGNEIGMGAISDAVHAHVTHGATIAAVTSADVLVTAACSNWGCYGIAAALAARLGDPRLVHTAAAEAALLQRGTDLGMINSVAGVIDSHVDGIPAPTHLALAELVHAVVRNHL
ncbi:glutamate cyclase domain-containing protein [Mycobacterium sp. 236(2023)]|uniref:glutamate cyclase domain-containing protein n=1 Tax=Mycobacterium sp. 236(2023) TaxID=3038163 RepID=UPI00241582EC|nr:glutamate cyclase domain-containing protein [Mycobacterium sp. 236(2023)]MDG4669343.1 DUF4392 domain-containing protein [Mycobacterium sp. 236(2023)]